MKYSEIIKSKLVELGGSATIKTLNGKPFTIKLVGDQFWSNKLFPAKNNLYDFKIFDCIQDEVNRRRINSELFDIKKGQARKYKLGHEKNDRDTLTGILGYDYFNKKDGNSTFDPIFVIAAILDFSKIAINRRGYVSFIK